MERSWAVGIVIGAALSSGFKTAVGGANNQFTTLGATIKDLSGQRGLIERFERDQAALEQARLKLRATQKEVGRLKLALRKDPSDTGTAKALEQTQAKAEKLSAALEKQSHKLRQSGQAMQAAGIKTKDLGAHYTKLGQVLDQTRAKHARLEQAMARKSAAGQRLSDMRGQALGLAGAVYGAGRLLGQAADFSRAETRLSTVANTTTLEKDLAASRRHALNFTRGGLATETEVLDIEYALNSAGLDAQTSRLGSEIVAKVATVTSGSAEGVGEVVATVFNNLGSRLEGEAGERLERIGDLLTKTQFKFQIRDFGQLGESMKLASPALAQYNMELSQGLTLIGALNSAGLQGSMAGTALSATFRNLSKASEEFGFEIARDAKGGLDFIQTMENLSETIGGFESLDQQTIDRLQKAFGEEGVRGVVLLGQNLQKLREAQQDVAEGSRGIVDTNYQRFLNDAKGQTQLLANNTRVLGLTFAGTLLPAVNRTLKPLTAMAGWVGRMIERFPVIGHLVGGVAVGVAGFAVALGVVTAATWLWNAALLANPIGLVVAAVIGGAALVISFWEPITGFFQGLWGGIKGIFSEGVAYLTKVWEMSPLGLLFKAGKALAGFVGGMTGAAALGTALAVSPVAAAPMAKADISRELALPEIAVGRPERTATVANNQRYEIVINAGPGQNAKEIAAEVERQMRERESREQARARGALHD